MSVQLSGRCTCGAISYATSAEPNFTLICQCRQCQRISGSGHAAQFAVPASATSFTGVLTFYEQIAESGNAVSNGFCGNCGNPILKKTTKMPELFFFHAATLDDPSGYIPQLVVFHESKQPWDHADPNIPRN